MLSALFEDAIVTMDHLQALESTARAQKVPITHLLSIFVALQLRRDTDLDSPDDLASLVGISSSDGRRACAALHAEGWITLATDDTSAELHMPALTPADSQVPAKRAKRRPRLAPENPLSIHCVAWVKAGGKAPKEFSCRQLHAAASTFAVIQSPPDIDELAVFIRKSCPHGDFTAFILAIRDHLHSFRLARYAAADVPRINWPEVWSRADGLAQVWTRKSASRPASDRFAFLFAALRGVEPRELLGSPLGLLETVESALSRSKTKAVSPKGVEAGLVRFRNQTRSQ